MGRGSSKAGGGGGNAQVATQADNEKKMAQNKVDNLIKQLTGNYLFTDNVKQQAAVLLQQQADVGDTITSTLAEDGYKIVYTKINGNTWMNLGNDSTGWEYNHADMVQMIHDLKTDKWKFNKK